MTIAPTGANAPNINQTSAAATVQAAAQPSSSSSAPGQLAQQLNQAAAGIFVQAHPKNWHKSALSPRSEALVIANPAVKQAVGDMLAGDARQLKQEWGLTPAHRGKNARKKLDFLTEVQETWNATTSVAEVHNRLAANEALFRKYSEKLASTGNAVRIQMPSRATLNDPGAQAHLAMLRQAMLDMTGENLHTPEQLWTCLTGRDKRGNPETRNYLLTVLTMPGVGQIRFFSGSGGTSVRTRAGKAELRMMGLGSQGLTVRCLPLPPSTDRLKCAVQGSLSDLRPSADAPVRYVGYSDLLIGADADRKEARMMPRTLTLDQHRQFHDRARDTEYTALSAMLMILEAHPDLLGRPFEVTMFSRLPMCHACQNAATFASMNPLFKGLQSFRVYGA
ncbi:MAG TPA: hypothetical protein VFV39_03280 [Limnobacter sp.]|nr:hypothetical protein [Limnobacter sp.]